MFGFLFYFYPKPFMMKKFNPILICLLLSLFMATSCIESITGNGPVISDERTPGKFTSLALNLGAEVRIVKANENSVMVTAQQNLTDRIITRVDGNTLVITSKGNLISNHPIKIEVRMPEFENFEINGSGEIEFDDTVTGDYIDFSVTGSGSVNARLDVRKVTTVVTGSGTVRFSGQADDLKGEVLGSGVIDASSLIAENGQFKLSGSGEVRTHVTGRLNASVTGSGILYYTGNPELQKSVTGSGKVIPSR